MKDKDRKQNAQPSRPVRKRQAKRGRDTTPTSRTVAPTRSAAGQKAARTRARRAIVLKTLKTGKESFSRET